jgi:hypothetical protein
MQRRYILRGRVLAIAHEQIDDDAPLLVGILRRLYAGTINGDEQEEQS